MNGDIKEEFYIAQPKGFEISGKEHMVYKLNKALHGLKQAPREWYSKLDGYLQSQGFHKSYTKYTLHKKISKEVDILLVYVYMDDVIYMSSSMALLINFRDNMKNLFDMSDLDIVSYFLGLEVKQHEYEIHVSQKKYVEHLLKEYNLLQCKSASVPSIPSAKQQLYEVQMRQM